MVIYCLWEGAKDIAGMYLLQKMKVDYATKENNKIKAQGKIFGLNISDECDLESGWSATGEYIPGALIWDVQCIDYEGFLTEGEEGLFAIDTQAHESIKDFISEKLEQWLVTKRF